MTPTAETIASKLNKAKRTGNGWMACCPAHEDGTPSLSINDGEKGPVFKCHAGCSQESVLTAIEALGVQIRKPKTNGNGTHSDVPRGTFNVEILAAAKQLPPEFLLGNGVHDDNGRVGFKFCTANGEVFRTKYRAAISGDRGFKMSPGEGLIPYGLWRLEMDYANDGRVILCEGETDTLTLWHHGFTALGIPGVDTWRDEWAEMIPAGAKVYLAVDGDAAGEKLAEKLKKSPLRKRLSLIHFTPEVKDPSVMHCSDPGEFVDQFESMIKAAEPVVPQPIMPMRWGELDSQTPPIREWAIDHWFGMGHVTLMAGAGGLGKTSVAQAMASCLSTHRDYLDNVPKPRRTLMWACEDDAEELWRRQLAIAKSLGMTLKDFESSFFLMPYDGEDVELCRVSDGVISISPMMETLRQQIGDFKAEAVILDNIARLYGCNENDRHQVTSFIAMLTKATKPTRAAVMLLGHPAKGPGSEYSGSTAWEGAVRSRLYLGRTLPDQEPTTPQDGQDTDTLFLCRRKANYSTRDYRRIRYVDGVMIPDGVERPVTMRPTEYAQDIVIRAVVALERMGKYGNASTASPDYLPKLAHSYGLTEGIGSKQFGTAMRELEKVGKLKVEVIGQYPNRAPKKGFRAVL
jgi:hypothetical protein